MQHLLVTGANGFVGRAFCQRAADWPCRITAAVRRNWDFPGVATVQVGDIGPTTQWNHALKEVDTVVHLAAHVHQTKRGRNRDDDDYERVNDQGTLRLAEMAVGAGVRRLVFLSTVKVFGEGSKDPFSEASPPNPQNPYAASKLAAEKKLFDISRHSSLEITTIQPPLVYGPGVKANFLSLLRIVDSGWPLPLLRVHNQRSLIYVDNLVDAIWTCATHPAAAGERFVVCDDMSVSTPVLIRQIAQGLGKQVRLYAIPDLLLKCAEKMPGPMKGMAKLNTSLFLDTAKIKTVLDWSPPFTLEQGIMATTHWYRHLSSHHETSF